MNNCVDTPIDAYFNWVPSNIEAYLNFRRIELVEPTVCWMVRCVVNVSERVHCIGKNPPSCIFVYFNLIALRGDIFVIITYFSKIDRPWCSIRQLDIIIFDSNSAHNFAAYFYRRLIEHITDEVLVIAAARDSKTVSKALSVNSS